VLLTATPKVPGLDGRKMSKSYGNTIGLREDPDEVAKKLKTMQTDPARVRRTGSGQSGHLPGVRPAQDLLRAKRPAPGPRMAVAPPASAAWSARSR
jgi:tryptophanyl-tRNA synthetase